MDTRRTGSFGIRDEAIDQPPADAAVSKSRRNVDMQVRRKLPRQLSESREIVDVGEARRQCRIVDGSNEIADDVLAGKSQIRKTRIVLQVAAEPSFPKRRACTLALKRFLIARFKKDRVDLAL